MNISHLSLFKAHHSSWVSLTTWLCLKSIVDKYLRTDIVYVYLETEAPPQELWPSSLWYVSSNLEFHNNMETDAIFILKNYSTQRLRAIRGRVVIVTSEIEDAHILWDRYTMLDVVVLVPVLDCSDVYSWSESFKEKPQMDLIFSCDNVNIANIPDLFPKKNLNEFMKRELKIIGHFSPGYADPLKLNRPEDNAIKTMATDLGLKIRPVIFPDPDRFFHCFLANGSLSVGYLSYLDKRQADLAYGSIMISYDRSQFSDMLPIYSDNTLEWSLAAPGRKSVTSGVYSGFSGIVWSLLLINAPIFVVAFYIVSDSQTAISTCVLYSIRMTLSQPFAINIQKDSAKFLCFVFTVYSLHMVWFYQSTLLINLFKVEYETKIQTLEEAVEAGLSVRIMNTVTQWLPQSGIWQSIMSNEEVLINEYNATFMVDMKKYIKLGVKNTDEYLYKSLYPNIALASKIMFLKPPLVRLPMTFFMPLNHPLFPTMQNKLLQLIESGLFQNWLEFERFTTFSKVVTELINNANQPLQISNLIWPFYLLIILLSISCVIFLIESLWFLWFKAQEKLPCKQLNMRSYTTVQ